MLNREMKEDQGCTVRLPDIDTDVFRLYSKWLYTRKFHVSVSEDFQLLESTQKDLH
jgi:hypothetical protein